MFWTVPRDWTGETVFIVAAGPSLRGFDMARLSGRRTIVVNYPALHPDADMMYCGDFTASRARRGYLDRRPDQVNVCSADGYEGREMRSVKHTGMYGIETWPQGVRMGGTSLHGAINLAVHRGSRVLALLGADMKVAEDGTTHWDGRVERKYHANPRMIAESYVPCLESTVAPLRELGVTVLNATPGSALTCFPRASLEEALAA